MSRVVMHSFPSMLRQLTTGVEGRYTVFERHGLSNRLVAYFVGCVFGRVYLNGHLKGSPKG